MIHAINLQRLRNSEFIQFSKNFANLIQQKDPNLLNVAQLHTSYTTQVAELEELFKTPTGSPITAEMEELDYRRDEALTGLIASINAHAHHFFPLKKQAATALQNNLNLYNTGIQRENYQSETAIINNLINDWETKPELTTALTTLGLNEWTAELKEANLLFNEKYINRTQSYAAAPVDNQKSKRVQVMKTFYELRKCLEVFALINPSPLYEGLISEANQLIDLYIPLTKSRKKQIDPQEN